MRNWKVAGAAIASLLVWFVTFLVASLRASSWGDSVLPSAVLLFFAVWLAAYVTRRLIAARASSDWVSMLLQYAACYLGGLLYRLLFPLMDVPAFPGPVGLVVGFPLGWGLPAAVWFAALNLLLPLAFVFALQVLHERRASRELAAQQARRADGVS